MEWYLCLRKFGHCTKDYELGFHTNAMITFSYFSKTNFLLTSRRFFLMIRLQIAFISVHLLLDFITLDESAMNSKLWDLLPSFFSSSLLFDFLQNAWSQSLMVGQGSVSINLIIIINYFYAFDVNIFTRFHVLISQTAVTGSYAIFLRIYEHKNWLQPLVRMHARTESDRGMPQRMQRNLKITKGQNNFLWEE